MDVHRSDDAPATTSALTIPPSLLAALHAAGLQICSDQPHQNGSFPWVSTESTISVEIRPPIFRQSNPPYRDEQTDTDRSSNGELDLPHAPTRAAPAVVPSSNFSGRYPAIRTTGPQRLDSLTSGGPDPTLSAARVDADGSPRLPRMPQVSSAWNDSSPPIRGAGPLGLAPQPPRASVPPISAGPKAAVSPTCLPQSRTDSLGGGRRLAYPLTTGPTPSSSSQDGDATPSNIGGQLPLAGDSSLRQSLLPSSASPTAAAALGPLETDEHHTQVLPTLPHPTPPHAAASGQRSADEITVHPLTGQPNGQPFNGQLLRFGQTLLSRPKSVIFQNPISTVPSIAVSPSSTSLPASTPQSPHATAPLRDTFLAASLHAAPSTGHIPPPVHTDAIVTSASGTSFRTALLNSQTHRSYNDPIAAAPTPTRKGELMTISISDDVYAARLHMFQTALIGRLILRPGDKPWNFDELKLKLQSLWHPIGGWRMTSLGKGYYSFKFGSIAERDRIRATILPLLKPGILKLFQWTPRFNPNDQKTSLAQVWVRFSDLSEEYYDHSVIWGLARCIGTPLKIDPRSLEGCYAHFARVLVEIDLSKEAEIQVGIEHSNGLSIISSVSYERLPEYCHTCQAIGHSFGTCRKMQQQKPTVDSAPEAKQTDVRASKQVWQVVTKRKAAKPSTVSVSASLSHILGNLSSSSQDSRTQSAMPQSSRIPQSVAPNTAYDSSLIDRTVPPDPRISCPLPQSLIITSAPVATSTAWADLAEEVSQSSDENNSVDEEIMVDDIRGMLGNLTQCGETREDTDSAILDQSGSQFISDSLAMIPICTVSPIQVSPPITTTRPFSQADTTPKTHSQTQSPSSKKKRKSKRTNKNWR